MREMFYKSSFNGDISKWNTQKVTNMRQMFSYSEFNGDISQWNVCSVQDMEGSFYKGAFNGDISDWSALKVERINSIFDDKNKYPYWAQIKDLEERIQAIEIYKTKKILNTLIDKDLNKSNNIKI